jgi:peptidoglycan/xylan/chitin deacetylase (PgdA/CDA1 family)
VISQWAEKVSRFLLLTGLFLVATPHAYCQSKTTGDSNKTSKKEICVTFDELPAAKSFREIDREAVTYLILDALKRHKVSSTGFVVGQEIGQSFDILGQWLNQGHILGSMTFSNQDYNYIGIEAFLADIRRGMDAIEPMLAGFGQKRRYFRYPFLHYGSTSEERKMAALFVEDGNLQVVHATVVPEDYLFNLSLEKLGKFPDTASFENLRNEYLNHVLDEVERVERLALELVKRPVKHILLLRANRLNAVYLDELLGAIEDAGYDFISLDEALKDRVYSQREAYYSLKGVGYLDMIQQSNPDLLPAE